jgi:hypothetical protein
MSVPPIPLNPAGFAPVSQCMQRATRAEKPIVIPRPATGDDEFLMPYGKAAKAIFVKANGLAAFYKSAGPSW